MKIPTYLLALTGFCCLNIGMAQDNPKLDSLLNIYEGQRNDSLKLNTLDALYNVTLYNAPRQARAYAREALQLSQELNIDKGEARALYNLGVYYNNSNRHDSAAHFYNLALQKYKQLGDDQRIASVNHGLAILEYSRGNYQTALGILDKNIDYYVSSGKDSSGLGTTFSVKGSIHTFLGNHNIALAELHKALKIFERVDNPVRRADVLNQLASVEFYLQNFQASLRFNEEALAIYREHNDTYYSAQALNDLGNTHYYLGNFEKAIHNLNESIVLAKKVGAAELEATALGNLGKTYAAQKDFRSAIGALEETLALAQAFESKNKIVEASNDLGMVYNSMQEPARAIPYFTRAVRLADSIGVKESLRQGYFQRSVAYSKLGNYKAALDDMHYYLAIHDSLFNETKSRQIEEMRTIYETEKKEQQIAFQEKEITVLEQQAEISRLHKILLAALLGLSLFGLYGIRQKFKRNKLEKKHVEAQLAFKKKELTTHALHLAKKNEVLDSLKQKAKDLQQSDQSRNGYRQLIRTIDMDLQDDNNWENFSRYFEQVHKDFNKNIKTKYPQLTSNELRLLALLKMNLSSKEIANILNISPEGIKKARYRLRKKLDISTEDSLQDLVLGL